MCCGAIMKRFHLSSLALARLLSVVGVFLVFVSSIGPLQISPGKAAIDEGSTDVYLPIVIREEYKPILLGIYPKSYWLPKISDALVNEFHPVDAWSGKHLSLAGVYHSIDQYNTITNMLPSIWDDGYTPFVNIYFKVSISSIISGKQDAAITAWAKEYAIFAQNGTRMAYLAPLQEMNYGDAVPYGSSNPAHYKQAFQRIRNIFEQVGVPPESVQWVFAPNGLSTEGWPPFESYYPGDDVVDVVSFSSYNFGYYPGIYLPYAKWKTPDETFTDYVGRMRIMAPTKPVFIAQTGTTAYTAKGHYNAAAKNEWLTDAYTLLAATPGVRGILYYNHNLSNGYDSAFYRSGVEFTGYRDGVANSVYDYVSPSDLMESSLIP